MNKQVPSRYSADKNIFVVPLEQFLKEHKYLGFANKNRWNGSEPKPRKDLSSKEPPFFYAVFSHMLVAVLIEWEYNYYSDEWFACVPGYMLVAFRDGVTEYEIINKRIAYLQNRKQTDNIKKSIEEAQSGLSCLTPYKPFERNNLEFCFTDFLVRVREPDSEKDVENFLILDVETNGLRKKQDDLLSVSIFDPSKGVAYNRLLPLDLQPVLLTSGINGITEEDVKNKTHISQKEFNELLNYFDVKNKTFLVYSGGKGKFDSDFLKNYLERHEIVGFENMVFRNIKSMVPNPGYGFEGKLTKDNLCRMFGIDGVKKTHSSLNDCLLEWDLFKKLSLGDYFFLNEKMYMFSPDYVIPITYLLSHRELETYSKSIIPNISARAKEVFHEKLGASIVKKAKKFPTNITGMAIEHAIYSNLHAKKQDNSSFLFENKKKLIYIGSLPSDDYVIPVVPEDDGTFSTTDESSQEFVSNVNEVTKEIVKGIEPAIKYLKENVFGGLDPFSQELVISEDKKILAICDLSSNNAVVEIKTYPVILDEDHVVPYVANQVYYQASGRDAYVFSVVFDLKQNPTYFTENALKGIEIRILKLSFEVKERSDLEKKRRLTYCESKVFEAIKNNPNSTKNQLAKITGFEYNLVRRIVCYLCDEGYCVFEGKVNGTVKVK